MGYGLVSNWVGGIPMTSERLDGIKKVLTDHGVSDVGAGQFVRSDTVSNSTDRQKLLELINMVVTYYAPNRHGGKGGR